LIFHKYVKCIRRSISGRCFFLQHCFSCVTKFFNMKLRWYLLYTSGTKFCDATTTDLSSFSCLVSLTLSNPSQNQFCDGMFLIPSPKHFVTHTHAHTHTHTVMKTATFTLWKGIFRSSQGLTDRNEVSYLFSVASFV
jgi:hypothetical protein